MADTATGDSIAFYRTPIERETLRALTKRSDLRGLLQAGGHLLLVLATGAATWWTYGRLPWPLVLLAFFVHGTVMSFMGGAGAFHELCHGTPFRSRWLNEVFLRVYAFLSWSNHAWFRTSHARHHLYTTHKPWDLEVVLPARIKASHLLWQFAFHPLGVYGQLKNQVRIAAGRLQGEWEERIFSGPEGEKARRSFHRWARIVLLGHLGLGVLFVLAGQWILVPILLTPFYAGWLAFLCAVPQHFGLAPDTPDWRRSCRTVLQGPFTRFLYWQMNYHVEHHMYASVPFHALPRLHRLIAADCPPPSRGLLATWREIFAIEKKLRVDPAYVFDQSSRG